MAQNLTENKVQILLNKVDGDVIKFSGDTGNHDSIRKILVEGHQLPGQNESDELVSDIEVGISRAHPGAVQAKLIKIDNTAPATDYNFNFRIQIDQRLDKHFTREDRERSPLQIAPVAGHYDVISTTAGKIDDSYLKKFEQDIVEQINYHYDRKDNHRVKAYRVWMVDMDAVDASKIDITIDGTTTTVANSGTANAQGLANGINANATVKGDVMAAQVGTQKVLVMSISEKEIEVDGNTTGTAETSIAQRYVLLKGTNPYLKFDVYIPNGFGTVIDWAYLNIDTTDITGVTDSKITLTRQKKGGSMASDEVSGANSGALISAIDALANVGYGLLSATGNYFVAVVPEELNIMNYHLHIASKVKLNEFSASGDGKYPELAYNELFNKFKFMDGHGDMAATTYFRHLPSEDEEYALLIIDYTQNKYPAQHGAGHMVDHNKKYRIYLKRSDLLANNWNSDSNPFGWVLDSWYGDALGLPTS